MDRLPEEGQSLEILVTLPVKSDWNKSLKRKSYFPACYRSNAAWIESFRWCILPSIISLLSKTTCIYLYYIILIVWTFKAPTVSLFYSCALISTVVDSLEEQRVMQYEARQSNSSNSVVLAALRTAKKFSFWCPKKDFSMLVYAWDTLKSLQN